MSKQRAVPAKDEILEAIREATKRNGSPPGRARFEALTGIRMSEWYGRYWATWGEALIEAGFSPNELQSPFDKDKVAARYLAFVAELGRVPTEGQLKIKARNTPGFPSHTTFQNALGSKRDRLTAVIAYAEGAGADDRTLALLRDALSNAKASEPEEEGASDKGDEGDEGDEGFVYLMKSGKFYRIGRTNKLDRRQYEVGVQLPEKYERVHSIRTDDPSGIEAYWHNRFSEKRLNGDWFRLNTADVRAFKRRKFM